MLSFKAMTEQNLIAQAMAQISNDTGNCIKFQPYIMGTNAGSDHIFIGKTLNSGYVHHKLSLIKPSTWI